MPNIASVLKSEISRLARKETRAETAALKKASAQQRSQIAALRKTVESLQKTLKKAQRGASAPVAVARSAAAGEEEGASRRWSAQRFAKHRARLGLSAADMGALLGVSGQSIYKWETGEVRPRRAQLEAIAGIRSIGKREAAARVGELAGAQPEEAPVRRRKPAARTTPARAARARKRA